MGLYITKVKVQCTTNIIFLLLKPYIETELSEYSLVLKSEHNTHALSPNVPVLTYLPIYTVCRSSIVFMIIYPLKRENMSTESNQHYIIVIKVVFSVLDLQLNC